MSNVRDELWTDSDKKKSSSLFIHLTTRQEIDYKKEIFKNLEINYSKNLYISVKYCTGGGNHVQKHAHTAARTQTYILT